ncbi:dethiobiotin synthase [Botrimarina sp.]|uniref:dethiobiotin synthase n=1 Tax=Botrimarina sp. TaxID=2795802 RepID=UPI0032EF244C
MTSSTQQPQPKSHVRLSPGAPLPLGLFITGTGTEVGKTHVAALIAKRLVSDGVRVGVYKPAASGCRREGGVLLSDDALELWQAAGRPESLELVCPQRFEAPLAPPVAAHLENRRVDPELLRAGAAAWRGRCDVLLVEGAGGLMSPLSDDDYNADLAIDLGYPLVVVAANRLGVINDTLQTVITASVIDSLRPGRELRVAGVVLNDATPAADQSRSTNAEELRRRLGPPLLACVAWQGGLDREVDWGRLARDRPPAAG